MNPSDDFLQVKSFQRLVAHLSGVAQESPHHSKHAAGLIDGRNKLPIVSAHNNPRTCYGGNSVRCCGHAEFTACWQMLQALHGRYSSHDRKVFDRSLKHKSMPNILRMPASFLMPVKKKYDLIVIRVTKNIDSSELYLGESRPCNDCIMIMNFFGIDKVYYSTGEGTLKCEKVSQMEFLHQSKGFIKHSEIP